MRAASDPVGWERIVSTVIALVYEREPRKACVVSSFLRLCLWESAQVPEHDLCQPSVTSQDDGARAQYVLDRQPTPGHQS